MEKEMLIQSIKQEFRRCERVFIALGEPVRQEIVLLLMDAECEGMSVGAITESTSLSRPAISHHLKILREAGIVGLRRKGTMNHYFLDGEGGLKYLCDMTRVTAQVVKQLDLKKPSTPDKEKSV